MANALIALGGNVGDVRATFQKAIANICGMTQAALLARSSDYATPPWGDEAQADFINACIEIDTSLDPHALLFTLHKIEKKFCRARRPGCWTALSCWCRWPRLSRTVSSRDAV